MLSDYRLNYRQFSKTQVILHPEPRGIIQFVGSFIFGSFPKRSYKYLVQFLFDQGYSLILYRFPFNPFQLDHWEFSLEIIKEQKLVKQSIVEFLKNVKSDENSAQFYQNQKNYQWLGHSLGCKYILLLEILSHRDKLRLVLNDCLEKVDVDRILKIATQIQSLNDQVILNQPSVLLAPEISNTVRFLRSKWRISNNRTRPTQKQTQCLISSSKDLFNLTGVISFYWDTIAEDDVTFLVNQLNQKYFQPPLYKQLEGGHFEPLGLHIETLGSLIDDFFVKLRQ